jgi:hypothetical protein
MTYIGDKESNVTVVWIAERFRDEHRAAIDWLNESTIEGFNFFAVEIQAMKIGSSLPAPRFNVVARPNEFSRIVTRTTRQAGDTERHTFYTAYWSQFSTFLGDKHSDFKVKVIPQSYYCSFRIGRAGVKFGVTASRRDKKIGVELYISRSDEKATFRALEAQKAEIENSFGDKLDWQELPEKRASRIAIFESADPANEADRRNQFEWLASKLERFRAAFYDRVRALNIEGVSEDEDADQEP